MTHPAIKEMDLETLKGAAVKYRAAILMMMILGADRALKYFEGHPGIRYKEFTPELSSNAELRPYSDSMTASADDSEIKARCLETFLGAHWSNFSPNKLRQTVLSKVGEATHGEGLTQTEIAKYVLMAKAKSLSNKIYNAIWSGVRDESGTTTASLFNGFDTITATEITAGNIAAAKGNYMKLQTSITVENAVDVFDDILSSLDPVLRENGAMVFCSQNIYDNYCRCYRNEHGSLNYNNEFKKIYLDGSDGKIELVPMANKTGSSYITIAPKNNMLYGYDNMGADLKLDLRIGAMPFLVEFVASSFFGVNFATLDKSMLMIVELADTTTYTVTLASSNASHGTVEPAATNTVAAGGRLQINAVAKTGYHFTKWSDNNENASRVIVVNGDMSLTATFAQDEVAG